MQPDIKDGYIKCRLFHLEGRSVVQPDILFQDHLEGNFFLPRFFYPNCIAYFDDASKNHCHFILVVQDDICLNVSFLQRNHLVTFSDGSVIYKCTFSKISGKGEPQVDGHWRLREEQRFQLNLFHHTTEEGYHGITKSKEIWGSRLNIQGNLYLSNIAYAYFTNLPAIRTEEDLQKIAMSNSGLIGVVPTNAPYHPHYAKSVPIPKKQPTHISRAMGFWIDADLIAPNHLW